MGVRIALSNAQRDEYLKRVPETSTWNEYLKRVPVLAHPYDSLETTDVQFAHETWCCLLIPDSCRAAEGRFSSLLDPAGFQQFLFASTTPFVSFVSAASRSRSMKLFVSWMVFSALFSSSQSVASTCPLTPVGDETLRGV